MRRLHGTYRLYDPDPLTDVMRTAVALAWTGVEQVRPGEVSLTRRGTQIDATDSAVAGVPSFVMGFRFSPSDDSVNAEGWYPQGLTGSADADASGFVDKRNFLIVSWYSRNPGAARIDPPDRVDGSTDHTVPFSNPEDLLDYPCSRISLIDVTEIQRVEYRHILLVEPVYTDGRADFVAAVERDEDGNPKDVAHCGGCVWFGRWLYVATGDELLLFDMNLLSDLAPQNPTYADSTTVGFAGGKYQAFGYRYILPLIRRYRFQSMDETIDFSIRLSAVDLGGSGPFSTLGLDRSTDPARLVAAQYVVPEDPDSPYDQNRSHRVAVFWALDERTGLLADLDASDAFRTGTYFVQGVHAAGDTMWFSQSTSGFASLAARSVHGGRGSDHPWPLGAEGLTYSTPLGDRLWCVTEYRDERVCFCVQRGDLDP